MDGKMYAFDGRSGTLHWTFEADGEITNAPTVEPGMVLFGTIGGSMYGIDADEAKVMEAVVKANRKRVNWSVETPK